MANSKRTNIMMSLLTQSVKPSPVMREQMKKVAKGWNIDTGLLIETVTGYAFVIDNHAIYEGAGHISMANDGSEDVVIVGSSNCLVTNQHTVSAFMTIGSK